MKTTLILLIAVLLAVAVIGCGTTNGFARDLEGAGKALREITQPAVDSQEDDRVRSAVLDWQERND